eukprot:gene24520-54698_t
MSKVHEDVVANVLEKVQQAKGVTDLFSGDRVSSTYNAVRQVGTHRTAVCACGRAIADMLSMRSAQESVAGSMGASTGDTHCGNMGCVGMKKFMTLGPAMTFSFALERFIRSTDACFGIDHMIAEDAGNTYHLRMLQFI